MDRDRYVKLASWNVESIRAHHDQVLGWVDAHEPDLLCMQETKAGAKKFPTGGLRDRGYELIIHGGDDGRGGVAVASRLAFDDVVLGIPGAIAPLDEARSIALTVDGLRLHTAYAPNGRKVGTHPHEIKLAWFTLYAAWLQAEREHFDDLVLAADLNIAPLDIDVWEAHRYRKRNLTSPPERAAFKNLLDDGAMVDVVRAHYGDRHAFTWWNRRSDFYGTDRGWRLDHVLATPTVATRVTSVLVDREERGRSGSSDHAPLLVTIDRAS